MSCNAGCITTLPPDVISKVIEGFLPTTADNNFRAEPGKKPGNVFTDAFTGSSNDGYLASEVEDGFFGG
jgi:hypothetical protein